MAGGNEKRPRCGDLRGPAKLLAKEELRTFGQGRIGDATQRREVPLCLCCASRGEANALVRNASSAGGSTCKDPQDCGFMGGHRFQDADGLVWERL
jgi:uncharacterized protein